jgi:hypothetical protein
MQAKPSITMYDSKSDKFTFPRAAAGSVQVRSVQVGPVELSKSGLAKNQARTKTELVLGGAMDIPRNCFSVPGNGGVFPRNTRCQPGSNFAPGNIMAWASAGFPLDFVKGRCEWTEVSGRGGDNF